MCNTCSVNGRISVPQDQASVAGGIAAIEALGLNPFGRSGKVRSSKVKSKLPTKDFSETEGITKG